MLRWSNTAPQQRQHIRKSFLRDKDMKSSILKHRNPNKASRKYYDINNSQVLANDSGCPGVWNIWETVFLRNREMQSNSPARLLLNLTIHQLFQCQPHLVSSARERPNWRTLSLHRTRGNPLLTSSIQKKKIFFHKHMSASLSNTGKGDISRTTVIIDEVIKSNEERYKEYQWGGIKIKGSTGEDVDFRKLSRKIIDAALSF